MKEAVPVLFLQSISAAPFLFEVLFLLVYY
jgi:hypothetical protein